MADFMTRARSWLAGVWRRPWVRFALAGAIVAVLAFAWNLRFGPPPRVGYGPICDSSDPDCKPVDFARLEHELPLTDAEIARITPANIKHASQEQVDQIYARLSAGPIPDGAFDGDLFFARGDDGGTRLAEILGAPLLGTAADAKIDRIEHLGRFLWKGKVFYRDERLLRNRIEDVDGLARLLGIDTSALMTMQDGARDAWLLFPARLHCGQSLLDGRRESIVIDYAFTDALPGYVANPDALAGRDGLAVRDEIRMVRPGFYLGRAYLRRIFALNFTLVSADAARSAESSSAPPAEDCDTGMQARE